MDYTTFLLIVGLTFAHTLADLTYPDPIQDPDQDLTDNNQDKRTLCAVLNNCVGGSRPAYLKRVVVRPQVVRPVIQGGYRYTKPKVHFALKAPSAGWKPVNTAVKPVVEVLKPEAPAHVHLQPGHIHLQPSAPAPAHVDQVHQVTVPHGGHYDTFTHVDHLPVRPFVPSPVLFEVTRPNLGVLPLGAKFLTPILKDFPRVQHVHVAPAPLPIHHHVAAPPHVHAVAAAPIIPPHVHAVAPTPIVPPHVHAVAPTPIVPHHVHAVAASPAPHLHAHLFPQPGTISVEYHGTRNYVPVGSGVAAQALPFEHASHGFAPQQGLPHEHQAHFLEQQQQLQALQQYQDIPPGQLPLEGEGGVIQPGQTDVQIPYHLPQHGAWQLQGDFRPSPELQSPYSK